MRTYVQKHSTAPIGEYVGNQNPSSRLWVRHATRNEGLLRIPSRHEGSKARRVYQLVELDRLRMGARTSDARLGLPRAALGLPNHLGVQPQLGLRVLDARLRNKVPYFAIAV